MAGLDGGGGGGGGNNPPPPLDLNFKFPIPAQGTNANLKNIPPTTLPHFYGLITKDLDTFLFEFDVLCRSYDYTTDAHRLKLFPSTLKDSTLHWFMSLGEDFIVDWDTMRENFLKKYKEYWRESDMRGDDIFCMQQKDKESLEDYIKRFLFSLKKSKHNQLSADSQKLVFLRGINEECIDALNLMGGGDITQETWNDIQQLCKNYSRVALKSPRGYKYTPNKSNFGVSRIELTNLLKDFQ